MKQFGFEIQQKTRIQQTHGRANTQTSKISSFLVSFGSYRIYFPLSFWTPYQFSGLWFLWVAACFSFFMSSLNICTANFTSPFTRLLLYTYDTLGSWWVRYKPCLGVPDYISWEVLQMSYCSAASPQPAVSQAGKLMWQCSAAERRRDLCLLPIPWS